MKLFYSVVKRFNRVFRPEYSVVERQGVRLLLNKNNWIDNRLLSFRRYEAENLAFILRHLQTGVYNRFIDIGANIGFFTAQALKNSPVERVMSFEPMSNNFYHLGANVLMNRGCKQVNIYPYALDRQRGKSVIHYDVNSTGIGTLRPDSGVRDIMDYTHQEEIECRCFDDEFEIAGETLFIKIDVEQFEAEALRGMQTLFEKNQILLIVEINTPNSEAFQILKSFGMMQILCMGEDYVFTNFDYEKVSGLC